MTRRVIAAAAAILLATVGAFVLVGYVGAADQRAMAGMASTSVLVVTTPVAEGTPADQLAGLVTAEDLPAKAVVPGAVTSLDELSGLVATADLHPGEQLLAARFADTVTEIAPTTVEVPAGMQEVSVLLEPQRVVGGRVAAGDTVGVFISLGGEAPQTHLILNKALVTQVQGAVPIPEGAAPATGLVPAADTAPAPEAAPTSSVMVTLALSGPDAERVVFGSEHGTVWLSKEPAAATVDGTRIVTRENVF
ncbi:Flp pilus assembly protein CpaB [Georgenia sp. SYP-B2076]|uniref:Flp pilus assembly protein CpaB n=1 Tax=Georgenia sp. SYP-B2076 TaxID=2495881 RepID=UPI000F8CB52A|nr:RcpC/CpaB family pilus assembly protein [Georgenia sp. SYP-B2076]